MKIAIIGSSGLVGSALKKYFISTGAEVAPIKRTITESDFEGADVVINLAGEPISKRWTAKVKEQIKESRVQMTRELGLILQTMNNPPKLVINASAIGYYGNGGETAFNELSPKGEGFLSDVVYEWEKALAMHAPKSVRLVFTRFGIILSKEGGALKAMLPAFKMGLGGPLGSGKQMMSWIAIEDVCRGMSHVIRHEEISGPVNFVAPHPVSNIEFTKVLGRVLHRPAFMAVPEWMIRLIFGEMGEALLLSSTKVEPAVLLQTGYRFTYPALEEALAVC